MDKLCMIMYPQIHKTLRSDQSFSFTWRIIQENTLHEWSKSSVETALHVARIQFQTQA